MGTSTVGTSAGARRGSGVVEDPHVRDASVVEGGGSSSSGRSRGAAAEMMEGAECVADAAADLPVPPFGDPTEGMTLVRWQCVRPRSCWQSELGSSQAVCAVRLWAWLSNLWTWLSRGGGALANKRLPPVLAARASDGDNRACPP